MQQLPIWIQYVQALGAPIVALIAAAIAGAFAYRQWRTAQNKLKLDLFERRFKLYQAVVQLILYLRDAKEINDIQVAGYVVELAGYEFLFDASVSKYLKGILSNAGKAMTIGSDRAKALAKGDMGAVTQFETHASELRNWFEEQPDALRATMGPFLQLGH